MAGEVTGPATFVAGKATRGGSNPLMGDLTSSMADGSGGVLSVLIPTWPETVTVMHQIRITSAKIFCMIVG
jgi:hypothetical protein